MPKSKRDRVVHLTKTKKKGKDLKKKLLDSIRDCCTQLPHAYVFEVENPRNTKMKEIRAEWASSRFFFGKNKVMQLALGRTPEDEHAPNLAKFSKEITGSRGVLFTDKAPKEVIKYFSSFEAPNFARSGFKATQPFVVPAGILSPNFTVAMEPMLRKLGLSTRIKEGRLYVPTNVEVCKEGDILSPEQCKLLELFDVQMAVFRINVLFHYQNGIVTQLAQSSVKSQDGQMEDVADENPDAGDAKEEEEEEEEEQKPVQTKSSAPATEDADMAEDGDDAEEEEQEESTKSNSRAKRTASRKKTGAVGKGGASATRRQPSRRAASKATRSKK